MRTYLDHAATSPVRPEVARQVAEDLTSGLGGWANPSAQHTAGRRVGALLAEARARLAGALGVDAHEVLLTSGGTEADALVVSGRARALPGGRLVVSPIEHPAVLDSARTAAAELGVGLSLLEVDGAGRVELDSLAQAVAPAADTGRSPASLVSVMAANNETGVVQDMAALVARVREASGAGHPDEAGYVPVHSDAVAALGKVPVDFHGWGLDAMSLTGHKLGAPVGVGALVLRRDLALTPATGGGRQERGIRSGTQDVVAARALALAVELAIAEQQEQEARLAVLRRRILEGAGALPGVHATLPEDADHVASTAHLCRPAEPCAPGDGLSGGAGPLHTALLPGPGDEPRRRRAPAHRPARRPGGCQTHLEGDAQGGRDTLVAASSPTQQPRSTACQPPRTR